MKRLKSEGKASRTRRGAGCRSMGTPQRPERCSSRRKMRPLHCSVAAKSQEVTHNRSPRTQEAAQPRFGASMASRRGPWGWRGSAPRAGGAARFLKQRNVCCDVLYHTDFKTKSRPQWLPIWKQERKLKDRVWHDRVNSTPHPSKPYSKSFHTQFGQNGTTYGVSETTAFLPKVQQNASEHNTALKIQHLD